MQMSQLSIVEITSGDSRLNNYLFVGLDIFGCDTAEGLCDSPSREDV